MHRALRLAQWIDRVNLALGRTVAWLALAMVLLGSYNAVVRYLGRSTGTNLSSNAYLELQWYMFSLLFLLGAAYTFAADAHVRVDVIFARWSARTRAWIDLLGTLVFLLPFCVVGLLVSWPSVRNSWQVLEVSPDPGGLPRYPLKTFILVAFGLLLLQGISHLIKQLAVLRGVTVEAPAGSSREGL